MWPRVRTERRSCMPASSSKFWKLRFLLMIYGNASSYFKQTLTNNAKNISAQVKNRRWDTIDNIMHVIQIKYGLPYCVTCPSMSMDPGSLNPGTRRSRVVESRDPYEYWGRWHSFGKTYLICIITQVLENCFHTTYWHSVSEGGSVNSSWKWRPVIMSPAHNPLLLQLPILLHSMTLADI